jgi:hypothetical protein
MLIKENCRVQKKENLHHQEGEIRAVMEVTERLQEAKVKQSTVRIRNFCRTLV